MRKRPKVQKSLGKADWETSLERVGLENVSYHLIAEHVNRYIFASSFCGGKSILDLACGIGYGSRILLARGAKSCVGADLSKITITNAERNHRDVSFSLMDATQLGFCGATFDVVCSFETIEHIENYEKYLSEMKDVLKPGGLLIISTPVKEAWSPYGSKSANKFHIREFSQQDFCTVVGNVFNILGVYSQGFCSVRRFVLYPYEVLTLRLLGRRRIYLDRLLNRVKITRNQENLKVMRFQKRRFTVPKYIIAVCEKS